MAGTVVTTEVVHAVIQEVKFAWTSSAGGAADATTGEAYSGRVLECVVIPGTTTPTDLFDVVITDQNSIDVLHGLGANCSNASTTVLSPGLGAVANSPLTLAITNAGAATDGVVLLHLGV